MYHAYSKSRILLTRMTVPRLLEPLCGQCVLVLALTFQQHDRLVGLVVKASASRAGGPGFESR